MDRPTQFDHDIVVVGGCGHVGLPLGLALADSGLDVKLYDTNADAVDIVNAGTMPFVEAGAPEVLSRVLASGRLSATRDAETIDRSEHVVVVVGTPVDRYLSPDVEAVARVITPLTDHLVDGHHIVLRSTVYPGVTNRVARLIAKLGRDIDVSFCPERIAEGQALVELRSLPQIISGTTPRAVERADALFRRLTAEIVELEPEEAELAKLFTNSWRYLKFAVANQLFMIANDNGLDYERIRHAVTFQYPRAADLPGAGLTAGPCLLKDTMQITAFAENRFTLGHAAVMVNEGVPLYVLGKLEQRFDLTALTVGVLGMAFKAESDDSRSSLSYKMKRILTGKAARVLCTDPYVVGDPDLVPFDAVVAEADLLIIAAPHRLYRDLSTAKPVVDITNLLGNGVRV
ncbi:MAG TPA: nucleotide sugar dehydrogenase [Candidatus Dormibacteraeota bacterium]|nr:nucleotide sugar dehydrogenase [Candidatus Dormibacteraeota bacterium]